MSKLLVVLPSRGRPENAMVAIEAWHSNKVDSDLLLVVDDDDPRLEEYQAINNVCENHGMPIKFLQLHGSLGMVNALEMGVGEYDGYDYYGFIGDDHHIRTREFDKLLIERIEGNGGWGIAYGNDLFVGERIPTAAVMSANIIDTLGRMCLPGLKHLYLDTYWRELGEASHTLLYCPEVVIEHMHYLAGKSEEDEHYKRVNHSDISNHDKLVFEAWQKEQKMIDANKILEAK